MTTEANMGEDVECVERTIHLKKIKLSSVVAVADQEIEVRLPLVLGPCSYITNYTVHREDDTIVLRAWSANLGVPKEDVE